MLRRYPRLFARAPVLWAAVTGLFTLLSLGSATLHAQTAPVIVDFTCSPVRPAVDERVRCAVTVTSDSFDLTVRYGYDNDPNIEESAATIDIGVFTRAFTFHAPGEYTITVTVCDGEQPEGGILQAQDRCSLAHVAIKVTDPNAPPCVQWDVSGDWTTAHADGSYHPMFTFRQEGTAITGTAALTSAEQERAGYSSPTGTVAGTMQGNQLDVIVTWDGRGGPVRGRYAGTVSEGRVEGTGRAPEAPAGTGIGWSGSGPTRCVD